MEACATCQHFIDYRASSDEDEWANGYCSAPFHSSRFSAHYHYGGHWTNHESWCDLYERGESRWKPVAPPESA